MSLWRKAEDKLFDPSPRDAGLRTRIKELKLFDKLRSPLNPDIRRGERRPLTLPEDARQKCLAHWETVERINPANSLRHAEQRKGVGFRSEVVGCNRVH